MQTEIKIVLFNPGVDPNVFCADVYVDNVRKHCGRGLDREAALQEALDAIQSNRNQWGL